jgi:hypothetical protein
MLPQFGRSLDSLLRTQSEVFSIFDPQKGHRRSCGRGTCRCSPESKDCAGSCDCDPGSPGNYPEFLDAGWPDRGLMNAMVAVGRFVTDYGTQKEASRPVLMRQPSFHDLASVLSPLLSPNARHDGVSLVSGLWRLVNFQSFTNLVRLPSLGWWIEKTASHTVEPSRSQEALVDLLLLDRSTRLILTGAVAMAISVARYIKNDKSYPIPNPPPWRWTDVTMYCANGDPPPVVAVPETPYGNDLGICAARKVSRPRITQRCTDARPPAADPGSAWGFECTSDACEDAGPNTACRTFLMPQRQGRFGDSAFDPIPGWDHIHGPYWWHGGDIVQRVNVGFCQCVKERRRRRPPGSSGPEILVSSLVTLALIGLAAGAILGSGGSAAPIVAIIRSAAAAA